MTVTPCYSDHWKNISNDTFISVVSPSGQTDMPAEALEATLKAITLMEDFTDFDSQLPDAKYFCFSFSLSSFHPLTFKAKRYSPNTQFRLVSVDHGGVDASHHNICIKK